MLESNGKGSSLHESKSAAQACVHGQEKCGQENVAVCANGVGHAFMEMEESSVTHASLLYQDVRLVENVLPRNEAVWHADQQRELLQVFQEWLSPSRGTVVRAELRGLKPFLATCIDGFESMTLKDATSPKPGACILRNESSPQGLGIGLRTSRTAFGSEPIQRESGLWIIFGVRKILENH